MKRLVFFLFLSLNQLFFSQTKWQNIGPGGGSDLICSAINPVNPDIVFIGGDIEGIYRTTNGGETWSLINNNLSSGPWTPDVYWVNQIKFDPLDTTYKTIFNCTAVGLFKSINEGDNWELLYPKNITSDSDFINTSSVAIDPNNNNILYLGTAESGLFKTIDGGNSWSELNIGTVKSGQVFEIIIDPNSNISNRTIYIGSTEGVYKSTDNGITWSLKSSGLSNDEVWEMQGITANGNLILYCTVITRGDANNPSTFKGGIFKSENGAETWDDITGDLPRFQSYDKLFYFYQKFCVKPTSPNTIYIGTFLGYPDEPLAAYEEWGIYKTTNGGINWIKKDNDVVLGWMDDIFFGERYALVLEMAPSDSDILYWGRDWVNKTIDGGETWQQKYTQKIGTAWKGNGFEMMMTEGIGFSPIEQDRIFVAYDDNGPFRSDDGGDSFKPLDKVQNPYDDYDAAKDIEIDPVNGDVYLSRYDGMGAMLESGFGWGQVWKITNDGDSWLKISTGLPEGRPNLILDSNIGTPDNRTLYCCSFGNGVYKTTNSGETWTEINTGLGADAAGAWEIIINPNNSEELYLGINNFGAGGSLYKSTNGGSSWSKLNSFPALDVLSIEYDKTNNIIYVGATSNFDWSTEGALYKSTDSGNSWSEIFNYPRIVDIEINPQNPNEIFVAAQSWYSVWLKDQLPGVYRTTDAGQTWENITNNLQHTHVTFVKLDPNNTSRLFAGTGGGGLWSTDLTTDVNDKIDKLPNSFELNQNYPNPFNPTTTIEYSIPTLQDGNIPTVKLKIYDILGREVAVLINEKQKTGYYKVKFNASSLSSGIYIYRISFFGESESAFGEFAQTKKMILLR